MNNHETTIKLECAGSSLHVSLVVTKSMDASTQGLRGWKKTQGMFFRDHSNADMEPRVFIKCSMNCMIDEMSRHHLAWIQTECNVHHGSANDNEHTNVRQNAPLRKLKINKLLSIFYQKNTWMFYTWTLEVRLLDLQLSQREGLIKLSLLIL